MLSAPVRPFGPTQEPTHQEWSNPNKPNGDPYIRGGHYGWDLQGTSCYAVADGVIRHVDFGPSLGEHQFVIVQPDGSGWFYAHTATRLPNGTEVKAGDFVATIGDEGVPGAKHLHIEKLARWYDWYSTIYTDELHETWEAINLALSDDDKTWIHNQIKGGVQALGAALLDGSNGPSDWIPDEWNDTRLRYNLKKILATSGGGVDPDVIVEAVKAALREGTTG